jgi:predicted DNA-binding transcriptional regulator YafY
MARSSDTEKAERLNRARLLLQQYERLPEAVAELVRSCSISPRQAYRYLEQAQRLKGPVPIGDVKVAFTVKLSRSLVQRLRMYATSTGWTLSEIVSRALTTVLNRGGGRG